jgi:hypothetical protein
MSSTSGLLRAHNCAFFLYFIAFYSMPTNPDDDKMPILILIQAISHLNDCEVIKVIFNPIFT